MVATLYLKPRSGIFRTNANGEPLNQMASPTNVLLGTFMLWWGWLGFNCGSTFGISGEKWKLAARYVHTVHINVFVYFQNVLFFLSFIFYFCFFSLLFCYSKNYAICYECVMLYSVNVSSIVCYVIFYDCLFNIIVRVRSSFYLVENLDMVGDRRTDDTISIAKQLQPSQNYEQVCFALYRSRSRQKACESLFVTLQGTFWQNCCTSFII